MNFYEECLGESPATQVIITGAADCVRFMGVLPTSTNCPPFKFEMQIFVKSLTGKTITLEALPTDILRVVKERIRRQEGIPIAQQRIMFAGRLLGDHNTLHQEGITKECTLHVCMRCRGGGWGVVGPDLESPIIQGKWSDAAPSHRVHVPGLNLEFLHDGKLVIGNLGYGTFDLLDNFVLATCPQYDVGPTSSSQIRNLYFNNCNAGFNGETSDGKRVVYTKTFGDFPAHFSSCTDYGKLIIVVTRPASAPVLSLDRLAIVE